ncbi:histidine kinase [Xenococcus sp. PCC 7305]|uniref:sensor histidine kinase n=1 Tax=Xenococcus sp. PCC 7305 TaxID=102125 RepID=UPI0002ACB1E7|nr:sensor histidine kinase [Xenococcus sp. PCC 7305]ELS00386.1 histidine kinase [Xenococcus sp. PCC 7305]
MNILETSLFSRINIQQINSRPRSKIEYFLQNATIAKTTTSTIELELTSLNLQKLCLDVIKEIEERFQNDITINFTFKGNSNNILLDQRLILPILINLLDNAAKYSRGTEITVDLTVIVEAQAVYLIVQDYGIGIPAVDKAHIFECFYRSANTDHIAGSGVGLTVVKRCLDLYAGKIVVQSDLGKGSQFIVSIPLEEFV